MFLIWLHIISVNTKKRNDQNLQNDDLLHGSCTSRRICSSIHSHRIRLHDIKQQIFQVLCIRNLSPGFYNLYVLNS